MGDRLVRVAYLDEAGTSKADEEPYFVVAGIILAPDGQWNLVEAWMRQLVIDYLGEDAFPTWGKHYNFHAKDIWHGSGDFPRDKWPIKRRMELFEQISRVPATFGLPIVYSYIKKADFFRRYEGRQKPEKFLATWLHGEGFMRTAKSIDQWLIDNTDNEVAMLIAEDVDNPKKEAIQGLHAIFVDRAMERMPGALQAERIIEQVSFMRKDQSGILQLADWCAFILKRRLQKCKKVTPYFENLKGQIYHRRRPENSLVTKADVSDLAFVRDRGE